MDLSPASVDRLDAKRLLDLVGAGIGLVLLAPAMLLIALAIRLGSRGPIFFCQERSGRSGKRFRVYKFRTMIPSKAPALNREAAVDDPRITRVGQILRRTGLDELPQLLNVLRGEMSLVGPRPLLEWENDLCDERQIRRLEVVPGLTGLSQVRGRNAIPWADRVEWDVRYVESRSRRLDFLILVQTLPTVLFGRNAYFLPEKTAFPERAVWPTLVDVEATGLVRS